MAKKLLCVIISVLMVVSMLPVGLMADGDIVAYATSANTTAYAFSYSDYSTTYAEGDALTIVATLESDSQYSSGSVGANSTSGWASISYGGNQTIDWTQSGSVYTATVTLSIDSGYSYPYGGGQVQFWYVGGSYIKLTSLTVNGVTTPTYSVTADSSTTNGSVAVSATESGKGATILVTATPDSGYALSAWNVTDASGNTVTVTVDSSDENVGTFTMPSSAVTVSATFAEICDVTIDGSIDTTLGTVTTTVTSAAVGKTVTFTATNLASGYQLASVTYTIGDDPTEYTEDADNGVVTITMVEGGITIVNATYANTGTPASSGITGARIIYIDETYHGMLLTINGKTLLLNYPHEVGDDGYCSVCGAYVGTETETEVITIDGVDYVAVESVDCNVKSSGWTQVDSFASTSLIEALNQDGAVLVITRDTEVAAVSYEDGEYEKICIIDSWWSNNKQVINLGSAGHTAAISGEDVIDPIYDDGTTIVYSGADIYAAWVAGGYVDGGSELVLISNTSLSYTITNVSVLVAVDGTLVAEDVDVEEPTEPGDTDSDEDDIDVGDNEGEAAESETNPTTGVVLALVPMAIAAAAAVSSKRR